MKKATQLLNFTKCIDDPYNANSTPIYQTATFSQDTADGGNKYDYTRSGNPTRDVLQQQIAKLEEGKFAFAFNSGMAAINLVTGLLKAGDHLIAGNDLYGGTHRLITQRLLTHRGINVSFVDLTNITEVKEAFLPNTKMVLLETPSNPLHKIADIELIAEITHQHKGILAVDNSFMSPWLQQPLKFGADIIIHSATKYLTGHSDVNGGFIIVNDPNLAEEIKFIQNAEGLAMAPFECWLALRGLKTLGIRIERQQANAENIVHYLEQHNAIKQVYYPTLFSNPNSQIHNKQASGGGGVICFTTDNLELSKQIVENTQLFSISVSFGSVNSQISLPVNMSHLSIPVHLRNIPQDLIRLSIGIEDVDDLIEDLNLAIGLNY